ncbi:hypothetical protein SOV_38020 [Sporomusa ovata DSM 2662]|uniref:hypothetical protein n=1 Tax=Sporomusa ovata TaxID=2378 RepID=UPI00038855E2|nr:hypothetical protein [Sporomusa ovata]EQB26191.1 hypothetical protein SOV_3c00650 [Sporomusa ovata DSM 2662]
MTKLLFEEPEITKVGKMEELVGGDGDSDNVDGSGYYTSSQCNKDCQQYPCPNPHNCPYGDAQPL